ncbi:MAG: ComF family protein [Eubacteriales bacterium]|nr:ComF family protein [Eubacteriales bacterium]
MKLIKNLVNGIENLIFPSSIYCVCCGNIIDETRTYSLCDHCMEHIIWLNEKASIKSDQYNFSYLDKVFSCCQYGLYPRTMVFSLKYNGKTYIARILGRIMADKLNLTEEKFDLVVPVPMFKKKEKRRGFNQAALIGKYLGRETGIKHIADCLIRVSDTPPMRGLGPIERKENVKNMFIISSKWVKILKDKNVLLVDDIFTTGATASECARVLREAGARTVSFIAFASGNDELNK